MALLFGSICLSDLKNFPELIKEVTLKTGEKKKYINIAIVERKETSQFGDTHFISCAPKKDERKEGVNYIIGDLKTYIPESLVTTEQVNQAPAAQTVDDLPF